VGASLFTFRARLNCRPPPALNERADHMALYDDVEDTSLDLYAAVRNGYLQSRRKAILDAICDRDRTWRFISQDAGLHHEYSCATEQ
jgi:hypothetical protein